MSLQINVTLNAPDLPETGPWFLNSAAFTNYFNEIPATGELEPADNLTYTPLAYDESIVPAGISIDGTEYVLCTAAMLTSLKDKVNALDISYQNLRTSLRNAGIITNP